MTRDYAKNQYQPKKSLSPWWWLTLLLLLFVIIAGGIYLYLYNHHSAQQLRSQHTVQTQQVKPPAFEFRTIKKNK